MDKHRRDMRDALVKLFEEPVPENYKAGRQVLHSILGRDDLPLDRPVLCFVTNPILSAMAKPSLTPIVWETKASRLATGGKFSKFFFCAKSRELKFCVSKLTTTFSVSNNQSCLS